MTGAAWSALVDLVLPAPCAGCGSGGVPLRSGACAACVAALEDLRPAEVAPASAPPGLPPCVALGAYEGALRSALLAYKERGRHGLARPLGTLLAAAVAAVPDRAPPERAGMVLVPVPSTARAVRERHGDHAVRLARRAAARLRRAGASAGVALPLRALPRQDFAGLDAAARIAAAATAFRLRSRAVADLRRRSGAGAVVVLVDDIVTTGATLAAAARLLAAAGIPVDAAAVLAATPRRAGDRSAPISRDVSVSTRDFRGTSTG